VSIVWILLIATIRAWRNDTHSITVWVCAGIVLVLIVLLVTFYDNAAVNRATEMLPEPPASLGEDGLPEVEGFPVPPMDLPHYHGLDLDPLAGSVSSASTAKEVTGA
jgi:NADH-quinone oxidoreductase subunit H